ncbi:hypothetical protein [Streptomyces swartbergensis]|uniref:hypothetical protein n=1 Tax=Streptomyces swartbergensis TaxID=487165 RepID=UPI00130257F6|nr:hypothetical protein [Streptomyces swartbergensis]
MKLRMMMAAALAAVALRTGAGAAAAQPSDVELLGQPLIGGSLLDTGAGPLIDL